eukprot:gene20201-26946_t
MAGNETGSMMGIPCPVPQAMPSELFSSSTHFNLQQKQNLLCLLQYCLVEGDYHTAASICSVLLSAGLMFVGGSAAAVAGSG